MAKKKKKPVSTGEPNDQKITFYLTESELAEAQRITALMGITTVNKAAATIVRQHNLAFAQAEAAGCLLEGPYGGMGIKFPPYGKAKPSSSGSSEDAPVA